MKIVILGGRNHWISFELLSVFFSVVVLAPPKHKNIYCYLQQTRLRGRDETVNTKTWELSPPQFPLSPNTQVFFLCSRIERHEILLYHRQHNPIFTKNLKQRQYVLRRQGKSPLKQSLLWIVNLLVTNSRGCQKDHYCSQERARKGPVSVPVSEAYAVLRKRYRLSSNNWDLWVQLALDT